MAAAGEVGRQHRVAKPSCSQRPIGVARRVGPAHQNSIRKRRRQGGSTRRRLPTWLPSNLTEP